MKHLILITLTLFMVGCEYAGNIDGKRALSGGVTTGVVATRLTDKLKKSITPTYIINRPQQEICLAYTTGEMDDPSQLVEGEIILVDIMSVFNVRVKCVLAPCSDNCERDETWAEYSERNNGRFASIEVHANNVDNLLEGCIKNEILCRDILTSYGKDTVLVKLK